MGGIYFKWNIEKIILLPFGGITIFNEKINRPIKEEFFICTMGPIFQIIYYYLTRNWFDIKSIHYNLLIFNLLPMIPLDGSKILNLLLNKLCGFKKSLIGTNIISFVFIFILIIVSVVKKNILLILVLLFLLFKSIVALKEIRYIFNRFILERFYNPIKIGKTRYIDSDNLTKMFRDKKHIFIINKKYYTESEIIKKKFDLHIKV